MLKAIPVDLDLIVCVSLNDKMIRALHSYKVQAGWGLNPVQYINSM